MSTTKKIWLMKSEPDVYSIDNLAKDKRTWWEGVRNYQARNFMMQDMSPGDIVLFYHSSAEPTGIAGLAKVCSKAEADQTQFKKGSDYFEPKATKEKPMWFCVQVEFVKKFKDILTLEQIKKVDALKGMQLLKRGQRLSIQPVTSDEFKAIEKLI